MKWFNRIAEGFSPGKAVPIDRPLSIPNPAHAGCNSDLAQYSSTPARNASRSDAGGPTLHHSAWPDSRTRTTTRTRTKPLVRAADLGGVLAHECKFTAAAEIIGVRSGVGNYESGTWK